MSLLGGGAGGGNGTMSGGGVGGAEALGLGQGYSAMQQYGASGLSGLLNPGLLPFTYSYYRAVNIMIEISALSSMFLFWFSQKSKTCQVFVSKYFSFPTNLCLMVYICIVSNTAGLFAFAFKILQCF